MVIGSDRCSFELYIINNGQYQDYDIGNKISGEIKESGYDCFYEDVCEADIAKEIADALYETTDGQFKYIIDIQLEYTKDWDGEYDVDYTYTIVSKEPTSYFDETYPK